MATNVADIIKLVYELSVVDKGTKHLLASERQVQKETKQTSRTLAEQDRAVKRSASVAEQAARREVRAARQVAAAHKKAAAQPGLLRRGAAGVGGSVRGAVGLVAGVASVSAGKQAIGVTETLAKTTLTLHKSFGLVVDDAARWAAVSMARGADGKQMTMGFKALATQVRAATQAQGNQSEALDRLREKNALRIAQAEKDASRMKDQHAAREKLTRVQEDAARAEAELGKKAGTSTKLFAELGITQQELVEHGNDMNWVLRAVSDGLAALPTGTDKAAISAKLFGRTWTTIAPLVRDGSKAMDEQLALSDKYGATLGVKNVAELQKLIKAQRESKLATIGLQVAFGTKVAPTLTNIINKTSQFAAEMRSGTGAGGRFADRMRDVANDLRPVGAALKRVGEFLLEHPRLVVAAAGAYAAFKVARGTLRIVNDIRAIGSAVSAVARRAAKTKLAEILADGARGSARLVGRAMRGVADRVASVMDRAGSAGATAMNSGDRWKKAGGRAGRAFGVAAAAAAAVALGRMLVDMTDKLGLFGGKAGRKSRGNWWDKNVPGMKKLRELSESLGLEQRRGGRIPRLAVGGLVPILAAGGEVHVDGGRATLIPGDPRSDSTPMMVRPGSAVLTADGQARMAAGASLGDAVRSQAPHFKAGGVVTGAYSSTAYGPPWVGIQGSGVTATGVNLRRSPHIYGVAVDPSLIPLGSQVYAWPNPFGRSQAFRAFDTGGAIKGRRLDFYDWRGRQKQNAWGRRSVRVSGARIHAVGRGPRPADEETTATVPLVVGRSRNRAGLLDDAVEQGVAAGQAGMTRAEFARAERGARGARRNPILDAIAGALEPTSREVTVPGTSSTDGGGGGRVGGPLPSGVSTPKARWNPSRRPIARWIIPYLAWAGRPGPAAGTRGPARRGAGGAGGGGWGGTVVSGFRSLAEQKRIWASGVRPAARPGTSNHEGSAYPRGAVDVTQATALAAALARRPGPKLLRFAGAKDPVHFSHPHGGSYRAGGVVGGHNAAYYRKRFGKKYRGFYLWSTYGTGAPLQHQLGQQEGYEKVAQYVGARSSQHLPSGVNADEWIGKWATHQRFAKGGVVGGRLGTGLAAALTFRGGSLSALDAIIGGAVAGRLDALRAEVIRRVRKGGDKKTIQRLQSVIDLIDFEMGRRIGRIQDVVERRTARLDRAQAAGERGLRLLGVDPASPRGLAVGGAMQAAETGVRRQNVASLQRALTQARRTGNREVIRDATDRLAEAQDALAESLVRQVEIWRDQLRAVGAEAINQAQFRLGLTQSAGSILESGQRLAGVQDTAAAMVDRARFQTGAVIPALQQQMAASQFAAQIASATGDLDGWRAAIQDAASAAADIASAQAEAAELMRAAAARAAQDIVDAASHGRTMADLGLQRLELEQQLIGTFEGTGGAQGRADYIRAQIIPAIQGEIAALQIQQATAQLAGDQALATAIAEAIYAKQNDVLEQQLAAQNAIKDNTDLLKEFGGSTAFSYQNQVMTDLDVIRARAGA
jgi:3D (Asp-Asp-Asp) domain-containing protein